MEDRVVLGATGLVVSRLCFGTWQLSPRFWLEQSKSDIVRAMAVAFEGGVNFFDTADAYGDGYGETVLGEFISGKARDELVVCTKVFNHFNPDGSRYPDLRADHIRRRCEIELKRLQIESIDLYLLHAFDPLTPLDDVAGVLDALKEEGKIRHYGVSNHTLEQFRAQRQFGNYNAVQPPYSLLAPGIENDLLPYCQAYNVGVMVYSPLHKGLLTGKYTGQEQFTDFRKHWPDCQGERFQGICEAVQKLKPIADKYELSIYQLVLTATLMHPAIHVAVVGIKNPDQMTEALGMPNEPLSREDYFAIRKILAVGAPAKLQDARGEVK